MSRNVSRAAAEGVRKKRRRNSILWSVAAIAVIVVLLALEQVALLYLLATLGVAVLLIIVAFADLHGAPAEALQPATADDSAAIADGAASRPAAACPRRSCPGPVSGTSTATHRPCSSDYRAIARRWRRGTSGKKAGTGSPWRSASCSGRSSRRRAR